MTEETIVAFYGTTAQADSAAKELEANAPSGAITRYPSSATETSADVASPAPSTQDFWTGLFGGELAYDTAAYDRSIQSGSQVVSVRIEEENGQRVIDILDRHNPLHIEEQAARAGSTKDDERPRLVNRGTKRIRRFIVENPVEL